MGSKGEQYATLDLNDECFSSDHFRMYEFKVKRCPQARPHDWTRCPFAHPGEKAKRRDPLKFQYSGAACPEFRKSGCCRRGDGCPFAHGVFECWCHPSRYRTQICTDGTSCKRRVCFFAHLESEVRDREELPMASNGSLQFEPAAEVQQQMEIAQAYQVLLNASTQHQGGVPNFEALHDLNLMQQHAAAGLPSSTLAEHTAQLQQQLRQLQALQNMQLTPHMHSQQQQSQPQQQISLDLDSNYHGALPNQGLHQAQASPFAQSSGHISGGGLDSGFGRGLSHLSNLSLSMSLPNPNSMRPGTQISPLHSAHAATLESFSGPIGTGSSGSCGIGAVVDPAMCQMSAHWSSNASSSSPFQMDPLRGLPPPPQRSASGPFNGRSFSQGAKAVHYSSAGPVPITSLPTSLPAPGSLLGGSPQMAGRLGDGNGNGFSPLLPTGFPAGQPMLVSRPDQRHSPDMSMQKYHQAPSRITAPRVGALDHIISPFGRDYTHDFGSGGGGANNPLHSLASLGSGPLGGPHRSFSPEGALGSSGSLGRGSGLMQRASSAGPGLGGYSYMDRSGSGGYDRSGSAGYGARPPRWQQQQQQPVQQQVGGAPLHAGSAVVASPAETLGGVPSINNGAHAARLADASLHLDSSRGLGDAKAEASYPFVGAVAHPGATSRSLQPNIGEASGKQGNMYQSIGRPPAIREDQQLDSHCFQTLPPTHYNDHAHPKIGRNTSFDSILAELPRSLSEVGMSKGPARSGTVGSDSSNVTNL